MEQGAFSDLSQHDSYLTRTSPSEAHSSATEIEKHEVSPTTDDNSETDEKLKVAVSETGSSSTASEPKKTTNVIVYYMLSIGKFSSVAYVIIAVAYAFLFCFPCKARSLEIFVFL